MAFRWQQLIVILAALPALAGRAALADRPASQPAETLTPATQPNVSFTCIQLAYCSDWRIDGAIRRINLSTEQADGVNAVLKAARKELDQLGAGLSQQVMDLNQRRIAAAAEGDARQLAAVTRQLADARAQADKAADAVRERAVAQFKAVLTGEQFGQLSADLERSRPADQSAQGRGARLAEQFLNDLRATVRLTDEQAGQIRQAVTARFVAVLTKAEGEAANLPALRERLASARSGNDAAEVKKLEKQIADMAPDWAKEQRTTLADVAGKFLTDAQRRQLQAAVRVRMEGAIRVALAEATNPLDRLSLTQEQRRKVAELSAAAREALLQLDESDWQARQEMTTQLHKDIVELLTEEQRKRYPSQ
jgi:phage gp16-like protein